MKNSFTVLVFTLLGLTACTQEKKFELRINVPMALAAKADTLLSQPLLGLLSPYELGDTLYIPEMIYERTDLNKPIAETLTIPTNIVGEQQRRFGVYTGSNYQEDYDIAIEEHRLKVGSNLSRKSEKKVEVLQKSYEVVWVKDTSEISNAHTFATIEKLQAYLKEELTKGKTAFSVLLSPSSISPSSNTPSKSIDKQTLKEGIYKALRQNPNNAYIVTRQLTFNYGTDIALFEDIMKKADEQLESIKKLNNVNDCSFIVTPLAYYSCAEVLAPNAKYKALAREKREEIKRIAKSKGCNLTEVSIPNS
jgi:hypothetical protein